MRKSLIWSALCVSLLALPARADAPYTNPVIGLTDHEVADPFVLKWNGEYYLYCSDDPIQAFHSVDLVHWDRIGPVLKSTPEAWNSTDLWAPEVVYRDGKFYMYYTAARKSGDWKVTEKSRRVGVAVSDSPRGPFVDSGQPLTPYWAIDGTVFRDPDSGQESLFTSYVDEERLHGAAIVADPMTGPTTLSGKPNLVIRGTESWEDKDGDPGNGSLRFTNEGPTVFKRSGRYYLMYSGGSWDMPSYSLGYATGTALPRTGVPGIGEGTGTDTWHKVVPPLLRSTRWVEGPGHNCVTLAPNNVDDECLYHARTAHFDHPWSRLPFADRLFVEGGRLRMESPSVADLAAPDRPRFSDRFDGASMGSSWQTSGAWTVAGGEARADDAGSARLTVAPSAHFVLEANVRTTGIAGLTVAGVEVSLDYPADLLRVGPAHFPLTGPGMYHQLLVRKDGAHLRVWLDGVLAGDTAVFSGPAAVALQVQKGPAFFDGIALTDAFENDWNVPSPSPGQSIGGWDTVSGSWGDAVGGRLAPLGGKGGLLVKGDPSTRLELSATFHPGKEGWTGVGFSDGSQTLTASLDHNLWPYAHLRVVAPGGSFSVGLPRGFRYDVEHTLRVVRHDDAWTFFLDEHETASTWAHLGACRGGPFCEGASAGRFTRVSSKHTEAEPNLLLDGGFESEQIEEDGSVHTDNPWKLTGSALVAPSWSHSGDRRLTLGDAPGTATETVHLQPGSYTLHLWAAGHGTLHVSVGGRILNTTVADDAYTRQSLSFTVPAGASTVDVGLSGQGVGVDDLFLFRT